MVKSIVQVRILDLTPADSINSGESKRLRPYNSYFLSLIMVRRQDNNA